MVGQRRDTDHQFLDELGGAAGPSNQRRPDHLPLQWDPEHRCELWHFAAGAPIWTIGRGWGRLLVNRQLVRHVGRAGVPHRVDRSQCGPGARWCDERDWPLGQPVQLQQPVPGYRQYHAPRPEHRAAPLGQRDARGVRHHQVLGLSGVVADIDDEHQPRGWSQPSQSGLDGSQRGDRLPSAHGRRQQCQSCRANRHLLSR